MIDQNFSISTEKFQGPLEAPLPDEAPGTDDVAPDLDPHGG